jgi:hypothetical protein
LNLALSATSTVLISNGIIYYAMMISLMPHEIINLYGFLVDLGCNHECVNEFMLLALLGVVDLGCNHECVNEIMLLAFFGGSVDDVAFIMSPCQNSEILCLTRHDINQASGGSVWALLVMTSWTMVPISCLGRETAIDVCYDHESVILKFAFQRAMHTWISSTNAIVFNGYTSTMI